MKHVIDLERWKFRGMFEHFSKLDDPYMGVVVPLRVGPLLARCRARSVSFAAACQYALMRVINSYAPLRLRIEEGRPVLYDTIHPTAVHLRDDDVMVFTYFDDQPDFDAFARAWEDAKRRAEQRADDPLPDNATTRASRIGARAHRQDVIHFSVAPWIAFTALSHPRNFGARAGSVPRITLGRYSTSPDGATTMPISVEVHHGLMGGRQLGEALERLQALLDAPERLIG